MDGVALTDDLLDELVPEIVGGIQRSMLGFQVRKIAESEVSKSNVRLADVKRGVGQILAKSGLDKRIQNFVYQHLQTYCPRPLPTVPPDHAKEPISYIRRAQVNWEKRILKSMNSMCTELSVPLARKRPDKEQKEMLSKWTELGTNEPDLSKFRPVYAAKDFLDVIASLKNTNQNDCADNSVFSCYWGVIQVPLKVKDIRELQIQFAEMSINQSQTGVDDAADIPPELFEHERSKLACGVLGAQRSALAQEFAKKGCPLSQRGALWCQMLGVDVDDVDILYYEELKSYVLQHDLLVDSLVYKDVKLTTANDDQYFVFEDYIYQILLPFSRDTAVLGHFRRSSASPARSYIRGKFGSDEFMVHYPPNGVIPFHGFSMYVAPLCYVYNDPVVLYFVFREMYVRYFFRLHTLSSHPRGIVSLCLQFETLLQTHEPQLFWYLKTIGVQPLRIAFKWLIRAFSGYLTSEQVLLLWDRILAYNSLEILPVLAAAIFSFRKTNLMQVQTFNAAEAVLVDLLTLEIVPLIQLSLYTQPSKAAVKQQTK